MDEITVFLNKPDKVIRRVVRDEGGKQKSLPSVLSTEDNTPAQKQGGGNTTSRTEREW